MCSIITAAAVDTSVTPEVTWSGPGVGSGRHSITPVIAVDGSNMFTSTLQLRPLTSSDAGLYICSVTLSPAGDTTFINPSAAGNDSQSLDVAGKHLPFHVCFMYRGERSEHTSPLGQGIIHAAWDKCLVRIK